MQIKNYWGQNWSLLNSVAHRGAKMITPTPHFLAKFVFHINKAEFSHIKTNEFLMFKNSLINALSRKVRVNDTAFVEECVLKVQ